MDGPWANRRRPLPGWVRAGLLVTLIAASLCAGASVSAAPAAAFQRGDDWRHVDLVLEYLGQRTPQRPVVLLFGGSAARECTISDRNWRRQIVTMGGPRSLAFNLGASSQPFARNTAMVLRLPDAPTLILIGVNVGRYTSRPPLASSVAGLTAAAPTLSQVDAYSQHRFSSRRILTYARKRALVTQWLRERYPVFRNRFAYNAARLRELVAVCQERDFKVVLFNLPLDLKVIRHRMDAPRTRYRRHCVNVSTAYGVPWVNFVSKAGLVSSDFVDTWHLVEPGRAKWQKRVSRMVVTWMKRYGIDRPVP
ncbi:MAG: hypothetical protein IH629_04305, partial [Thermoleophilia bacterium]|nr:hypothetical protein [Thermoleophilia bacterium]